MAVIQQLFVKFSHFKSGTAKKYQYIYINKFLFINWSTKNKLCPRKTRFCQEQTNLGHFGKSEFLYTGQIFFIRNGLNLLKPFFFHEWQCRLEDYAGLRELLDVLPHGSNELANLGTMFESVGLGEDAVRALLRLGNPKGAIDACVRLNHWGRYEQIGGVFDRFSWLVSLLGRQIRQVLRVLDCIFGERSTGRGSDSFGKHALP